MIRIRRADLADAQSIRQIHRRSVETLCREDYTKEQIQAWTMPPDSRLLESSVVEDDTWVATCRGVVCGFGSRVRSEVVALYVDPASVRRGVGRALLAQLENLIANDGMHRITLASTLTAEKFYQAHGYVAVAHDIHLLRSGISVPIVSMQKDLGS